MWVVVVVLFVSASSLAVFLVRSETRQRHDVASIPNDPVLSDEASLAKAWQATSQFQTRAADLERQMELTASAPPTEAAARRAQLADQLSRLIMLRCAITGTGAELEERLGRRDDVEAGLVTSTAQAYARFSVDFDTAVVDFLGGDASKALATSIADTSTLVIEGLDPRVRDSLQEALSAVTAIREELARVARRIG